MLKSYFEFAKPLLFGFIGAGLFTLLSHLFSPPVLHLGVVNVNRLVQEHIKFRAKSALSEKELEIDSQQFMTRLESALKELAKKEALCLLVSEAIVTGAKDYTDTVRNRIERQR
jgi:Skp family chaperone for outer membrane proteins